MEKWYAFHWIDGQVFYAQGTSEIDAARKTNWSEGFLRCMDFVEEVHELPLKNKEIKFIFLNKEEKMLDGSTIAAFLTLQHIDNSESEFEIPIGNKVFKVKSEITPFEIVLTEYK